MYSFWTKRINEHVEVMQKIASDTELLKTVNEVAEVIVNAYKAGNKLLICGNGGSAADSQHIATELVSRFLKERKALDAEALSVNTSSLTAISNDYTFDKVFSRQVEAKGRPGDILIGITTSGGSKNILEAFRIAKEIGMKTVGLIGGNSNGVMYEVCDYCLGVPSFSTPRIQEAHILLGHMLCEHIENSLFS